LVVELVVFFLPLVAPLVPAAVEPLTPEGEAEAEELSDWSPVVADVLLLSDWSPVVVVVLLLSDWSPVDVALSMVTVERPRASMVGFSVELEPVIAEFTSADEPVTDEVLVAAEPFSDGDAVALVPDESEPVPAVVLPGTAALAAAWLSGTQSMWTGLAEWSFAIPVDLSASLPACGWFRLLHEGFAAVAACAVVAPLVPDMLEVADGADCEVRGCCVVALVVDWA
jgi:hypothetical protein